MLPDKLSSNPYLKLALFILSLGIMLGFVVWFRDILLPFLLAFIIAYILDPLVDWLEAKLSLGRTAAILVLILVISVITMLTGYYLTTQLIDFGIQLSKVAENPPDLQESVQKYLPETIANPLLQYLQQLKPEIIWKQALTYLRKNLVQITQTLGKSSTFLWLFATRTFGAVGAIINAGVFVIVTIYLLRDFDFLIAHLRDYIPPTHRDEIISIIDEIDDLLRAFLRGQLIVCLIMGVGYSTGLLILGIEGAITVGIISGLLNIIPYLGPAIGFLLAAGIGLYQSGLSLWIIIGVPLVFGLVQFLEGTFLTPNIVGKQVGINPVVVIFSFMLFVRLLGFIGFLAAIPLAVIFKVIFQRLAQKYRHSSFYAEND